MKIYLAGPMRDHPAFNFPAFHAAAEALRAKGHYVFSPAEADTKKYGKNFGKGNTKGSVVQAEQENNFSLREALKTDLSWICDHAEAIACLPGWEYSSGSSAEWATAKALKLKFIYL